MKNSLFNYIGWLLLISIFGFYLYGIIRAIQLSLCGSVQDYPIALSTTISSIQALLLTNLGALLGISVTNPQSGIAHALMLKNGLRNNATGALQQLAPPDPLVLRDKIQLFALVVYIASLIACTITWIHFKFETDSKKIVDCVSQSGKMFIGVCLAYLTVVFKK
jgi:hypothetical protein